MVRVKKVSGLGKLKRVRWVEFRKGKVGRKGKEKVRLEKKEEWVLVKFGGSF